MSDTPEGYHKDELLKLFEEGERSYLRRLIDMCKGFGQPKDSVEYKKAIIEFQRLAAPIFAVGLMLSAITVMCMIRITADEKPPVIETQMIEQEEAEDLTQEEPPPPEEMPETEVEVETDIEIDLDMPPSPDAEQSPQPSPVDAVALSNSPVQLKGVFGSRDSGTRGGAIGRYGAAGTEKLVEGFLRYLKMKQKPNGMWGNNDTGVTSIVLLCFLAHGEIPGQSPEFGDTVEKAIRGLIADQIKTEAEAKQDHPNAPKSGGTHAWRRGEIGYFKGRNSTNYAHLTAVYALSEAYAMTRIPDLKPVVQRALTHIIEGQNANGGWYYNMDKNCKISDSSYVSWAVQALKAAKLAGFHDPKVITALKKAAKGMRTLANPNGSFGYLDKMPEKNRYPGLTAPCVLILQMLDEGDSELARKGLAFMSKWEPTFRQDFIKDFGSPQYYCYYLSQVRFNQGDRHPDWQRWNAQQKKIYSAAAINIPADKSGYKDHKGTSQYITYWPTPNGTKQFKGEAKGITDEQRLMADPKTKNGKRAGYAIKDLICRDHASADMNWHNDGDGGRILSGCFTALQLMVYYRNSPLAKGALTKIEEETEVKIDEGQGEVTIDGIDDI